MAVSATFVPDLIDVVPNVAATLTLRLQSDDAAPLDVRFALSGDLRDHARPEVSSATLEANQTVEVPVLVMLPPTVEAGTYTLTADVQNGTGDVDGATTLTTADSEPPTGTTAPVSTATATVELAAHSDHAIALQPLRSHGASGGDHTIRVVNTGNVALDVDLSAEPEITANDIRIEGLPAAPEPLEPMRGKSLADHVQIGFAYQMNLEGQWRKVRLAHVSPARTFFIFTHGEKQRRTVSLTHRMLVRLCEAGRLRAFENAYLLERAQARARQQLATLKTARPTH